MIRVDYLSHHENEKHTEKKNKRTKIKTRNYVVDNGQLCSLYHVSYIM